MGLNKLATEQLAAVREHYAGELTRADGDDQTRRVAAARLAEIDAELAQRQAHPNGRTSHLGNRWPHVDLVALIRESGVTLREKTSEKYIGDHGPKHSSRSGACLVVWPLAGRWCCTSCKAGGDAASWLANLEGISYAKAARKLEARFGKASRTHGARGLPRVRPLIVTEVRRAT